MGQVRRFWHAFDYVDLRQAERQSHRAPPSSAEQWAELRHQSLAMIFSQKRRKPSSFVSFTGSVATQKRLCPQ